MSLQDTAVIASVAKQSTLSIEIASGKPSQ